MDYGHMGIRCGEGFFSVALLVVFVIAFIALIRHFRGKGPICNVGESRETPLDILKKRYARGEITREEYERIKSDLS